MNSEGGLVERKVFDKERYQWTWGTGLGTSSCDRSEMQFVSLKTDLERAIPGEGDVGGEMGWHEYVRGRCEAAPALAGAS